MKELPNPFIVEFYLNNVEENKSQHWLVFENEKVDLCHIDHGFEVDVLIDVSIQKLTKVWMGWEDINEAIKKKAIQFKGPSKYTKLATSWLGQSSLAHIKKRPLEEQVG